MALSYQLGPQKAGSSSPVINYVFRRDADYNWSLLVTGEIMKAYRQTVSGSLVQH